MNSPGVSQKQNKVVCLTDGRMGGLINTFFAAVEAVFAGKVFSISLV